jgi:hypothetical protein
MGMDNSLHVTRRLQTPEIIKAAFPPLNSSKSMRLDIQTDVTRFLSCTIAAYIKSMSAQIAQSTSSTKSSATTAAQVNVMIVATLLQTRNNPTPALWTAAAVLDINQGPSSFE